MLLLLGIPSVRMYSASSGPGPSGNKPAVRFRLHQERKPNVGLGEATHRGHHYTAEEQAKLATFQSISYLPLHTKIYKEWLKTHWSNSSWPHWVMMAIIGVGVGLTGALLKNMIQLFTKVRFLPVQDLLDKGQLGLTWLYFVVISVLLALGAAAAVVYLEPVAAGSGVPEVMAYLNGVSIPKFFAFKTLVVKFVSVALAVASGLCGGNEGPMIAIGASVGKVSLR